VEDGPEALHEDASALEARGKQGPPRRLLVAGIRQLQGELVELAQRRGEGTTAWP